MNQRLAKEILDSDILDQVENSIRSKLFKQFSKPLANDYDALQNLHSYSVSLADMKKEFVCQLTHIVSKDKVR